MVVLDAKVLVAVTASLAIVVAGCGLVLLMNGEEFSEDSLDINAGGIFENGTYRKVIVSAAVGDGHVVLRNITILESLIIRGGGSNSVVLEDCENQGATTVDKQGGESVRVYLIGTGLSSLDASSDLILEADADSSFGCVSLSNSKAVVQGSDTSVAMIEMGDGTELDVNGGKVTSVTVPAECSATLRAGAEGKIAGAEVSGSITVDGEDTGINTVSMNDGSSLLVRKGTVSEVTVPAECSATLQADAGATVSTVLVSGNISVEGADTVIGNAVLQDGSSVSVVAGTVDNLDVASEKSATVRTGSEGLVRNANIAGKLTVEGSDTQVETVNLDDGSAVDIREGTVDYVRVPKDSSVVLDKSESATVHSAVVGDNVSIDASDDTDLSDVYISMSEDAKGDVVKIKDSDYHAREYRPGNWRDWWNWWNWWEWVFPHAYTYR